MANTNLHTAKDVQNDEFYTQLEDIDRLADAVFWDSYHTRG